MAGRTHGFLGGHTGHILAISQFWRLLFGQCGLDLCFSWRLLGKHTSESFRGGGPSAEAGTQGC